MDLQNPFNGARRNGALLNSFESCELRIIES